MALSPKELNKSDRDEADQFDIAKTQNPFLPERLQLHKSPVEEFTSERQSSHM